MKFFSAISDSPLFLIGASSVLSAAYAENTCIHEPLGFSQTIGMLVKEVGSIPTNATDPYSYNMMPADNFDDALYFMDQKEGRIYCFDKADSPVGQKVFDMTTSNLPAGISLDWTPPGAAQTQKVHAMTQGKNADEVYVVFTSTTLPTGWDEANAKLPPHDAYFGYACSPGEEAYFLDIYRIGTTPKCFGQPGFPGFTGYVVFTKFVIAEDGQLTKPEAFFVSEMQVSPGHMGGGIVTVKDGHILWAVGDCLPFGTDGRYEPQFDTGICGKILLINPTTSSYSIVAKGVRNAQQLRIFRHADWNPAAKKNPKILAFADIGGVTAEEVNAIPLNKLLSNKTIDNFGWGRSIVDGKAREGTFYVQPGFMGVFATEPPCLAVAPIREANYIQPWIQFGRTASDYFYAISSFAIARKSFDKLNLIWSEFNTGQLMGTDKKFQGQKKYKGPRRVFKIKLYDADTDGTFLKNGFNDLVQKELGEVGRGDPRLFHFLDGTAGVFIERTGMIYRLTEMKNKNSNKPKL